MTFMQLVCALSHAQRQLSCVPADGRPRRARTEPRPFSGILDFFFGLWAPILLPLSPKICVLSKYVYMYVHTCICVCVCVYICIITTV